MKKAPDIRIKGFSDAWEQRKLSDMVERVTRKNENHESELPLTISAQYGLIDQNEFFDKRIASRDVSGYYLLKKGEFAYNKSTSSDAPWGAVKRLDRYEMGVLSTLYIVFALKEDGNIDSDFLVSYYDTDCWHKGVQAIAAEGARNHGLLNITPADYFETVLTVPSNVKEQHQIGTFFAKLDSLITLHQRKLEKLKLMKEAMLDKMFPKDDNKVPEIRFKGFTDDWEQLELSTIIKEVKRTDETSTAPIMMITAQNGFINQSDRYSYDNSGESLKKYIILKHNELAYNHGASKLRPLGSCFSLEIDEARIPYVYHCFSVGDNNPRFVSLLLNGMVVETQLRKIITSGARMDGLLNISFEEYGSVRINLPKIDEQNKIADYFSDLDRNIILYQNKIEKLKQFKESMLDKMFI